MIISSGAIIVSGLVTLGKIFKFVVIGGKLNVGRKISLDGLQNQDDVGLYVSSKIFLQYRSLFRFFKFSISGIFGRGGYRFSISSIDFNVSSKLVGVIISKLREFIKIGLGRFSFVIVN